MRPFSLGSLALLALAANSAGAQEVLPLRPRLTWTIAAGRSATSPIYTRYGAGRGNQVRVTDLSIGTSSMIGGHVAYRLGGWVLSGEVSHAVTDYTYTDSSWLSGFPQQVSWNYQRGDAQQTIFRLAVGRPILMIGDALSLETELGVGLNRISIGGPARCPPVPPAVSTSPCLALVGFERTLSVPSVGTGLILRYGVVRHLDVQLRGQYAVGRTSNSDEFWSTYGPPAAFPTAPTSSWIRMRSFSVGLGMWP